MNQKKLQMSEIQLITLKDPFSPLTEQFRTIRTNLQYISEKTQTILITSAGPGEGKSTVSANLAVMFAKAGKKVLLVDADLRRPTVNRTFGSNNAKGLSTLLRTERSLSEVAQQTAVKHLSIVTSGPRPVNPSELLGSERMSQLIKEVEQHYDYILFDSPPVTAVTDAQVLAAKTDGVVLVVREGKSKKEALRQTKELLLMVSATILGVVYNEATHMVDSGYNYF
ncbi:hypothetical protein IGI37_003739 [Enterococcus sp. AZ194]|uniref:CpsD/CapB family tyrosine-protein kinase n=1 Tax=Enterococcus sp. AZ194 TaxID=2774629 RepID=UPI003F28B248